MFDDEEGVRSDKSLIDITSTETNKLSIVLVKVNMRKKHHFIGLPVPLIAFAAGIFCALSVRWFYDYTTGLASGILIDTLHSSHGTVASTDLSLSYGPRLSVATNGELYLRRGMESTHSAIYGGTISFREDDEPVRIKIVSILKGDPIPSSISDTEISVEGALEIDRALIRSLSNADKPFQGVCTGRRFSLHVTVENPKELREGDSLILATP